jgi:hypothetical protein
LGRSLLGKGLEALTTAGRHLLAAKLRGNCCFPYD